MSDIKITTSQAKNIIDDFVAKTKDVQSTRESNFRRYQNFALHGLQWSGLDLPEGKSPALSFNQAKDFLDTYLAKLFPRNIATGTMEIGVKIFEIDRKKKEEQEKIILETYDREKLPETLLEQGQNFLYGGDACLYFPPDDKDSTKTKIISLDPAKCFIGWNGNKISQFAFEDEVAQVDLNSDPKTNWIKKAISKYITKKDGTEKFEKVKRITYWDEEHQIIKVGQEEINVYANDKGYVPFAWIPNEPKAHTHEGVSEVKKIVELEQEYNQRASNFADRVRINTKAILTLLTDKTTKDLDFEKILDGFLKLGKGDDAKLLTVSESPEILKYLETLEKRMNTKMAINGAVQGEIKSNVSSLSMMYYFSPLLDRIGLKRIYWDQAFRELNNAILRNKFGGDYFRTNPVYQPVLLTDKETQIKNTILLLENRLISYRDAIDELRGIENSEEKFKEIIAEYEELTKIEGFLKTKKEQGQKATE